MIKPEDIEYHHIVYQGIDDTSFGEDLTVHVMSHHELHKTNKIGKIISGYVLDRGELYGLVDCQGQQNYHKAVP